MARIEDYLVNAPADFGRLRNAFELGKPGITQLPAVAAVISPKDTDSGDSDPHPVRIVGMNQNRVETQSSEAGKPARTGRMVSERRDVLPDAAAIAAPAETGLIDTGVKCTR